MRVIMLLILIASALTAKARTADLSFVIGALSPIARWRGYRATYPQLSCIVLAPRT